MAIYAILADNWPPKAPVPALPPKEVRVDNEILLRPILDSDRDDMWKALNAGCDYLGEYLPWMSDYKTEDDHTIGFNTRRREQDNFDGSRGYLLEYKGQLAGTVGFRAPNRDNVTEVGYWLRQDLQGQGIMIRSVESVITMLFVEVGLHRVTIRAATSNLRSRGIPERLGFKHEGTMRDGGFVNNEYLDLEIYSMLDHEWLTRSQDA
ncbi:GNAT family N-acetyltransferase [Candidatus Lucifugimonas marina]|uniref:GNAT family N-acetyltransferase n=2 Tax=Candidatus Lucifugimonas marina TaxID=3038979 RepID=A0AAJ6CVS9_9CHLR|nr:GNAT family N-acetyltransferase [SAR202 cluster bacterium JH639]WFG40489.1 GNAT family N-acetyltransferase [SAR202 cluster bacterium JH1073]